MYELTWRCHVCGDVRPDSKISVCKKQFDYPGGRADMNVRFCNDREACREAAVNTSFFNHDTKETQ